MMSADRTRAAAIEALTARTRAAAQRSIRSLFDADPDRLEVFTLEAANLYLDLSKQAISREDLDALLAFAQIVGVDSAREAQLRGARVNVTEGRAALHTALRRPLDQPLLLDGVNVMAQVRDGLHRMQALERALRSGRWQGARGHRITDVVSIGIGGSHLGPQLACEALRAHRLPELRVHFLSNVDPDAWSALSRTLQPHATLFVVASKSWTTDETARNARAARRWLLTSGISEDALGRHFVAVTANPQAARSFGIDDQGILPFGDWVGGRFSLWSTIGLPVMLTIGVDAFDALLRGAARMDVHFADAPLARNAPVLLALVSAWNRIAHPAASDVVAPYCEALRLLPAYLQQLAMESNGKSVDLTGNPVGWHTAPVTWGAAGTDAQHSFFQALHQGTTVHPVEFLLTLPTDVDPEQRDTALLANAIAQAEALMQGRSLEESRAELVAQGLSDADVARLAPHRVHPGNRPSTSILLGALTPETLGALIALYEHKTTVLATLWGINAFDQWGVELGKRLAGRTQAMLAPNGAIASELDPSTAAMLHRVSRGLSRR